MNQQTFNSEIYGLLPSDIEDVDLLAELALNIRWTWNHAADELWQQLDPALWERTHNPWIILQTVSRDQLEKQLAEPAFKSKIKNLLKQKEKLDSSLTWFQQTHPKSQLTSVAYFSMEYMLSEALPIYSGGLGNVAGDQLKAASDLGVPVVAVGLLYAQGYFRQEIDQYGNQQALFPYNDPGQLPITPLRLPNGEWLRLKVSLPGYPVWLRAWQVQVGRLKLFLLDSNDAANHSVHRGITSELYGGGPEMRIKQEIILGIGGWKLLRAIGINPEVCHLNEGHAAFLVLERARDFMKENGTTFEEALAVTRAGNLFTTHTAVSAGFDRFNPDLMHQYLGSYAQDELNISFDDLMALGRLDTNNESESFNMAYLAIRGSGGVNGVSRLHGEVSRNLFQNLFPRWPVAEVPVGYVTNGVHMPCWDSKLADDLWTEACGKDRWRGDLENLEQHISGIADEKLWQFRNESRSNLVSFIRERFERQSMIADLSPNIVEAAKQVFNPDVLTLGFARRFVPYKRATLLLHDPERFIQILTNREQPVQLVMAGKAPPYDESGKALIRQWIQFIQQHQLYNHVIFLSDYDTHMAENLVQGVDVWVNTPRRPWEASGTSGMKVLVNGGLNVSTLDGWWAEAYTPEVGWALGDMQEQTGDASEADALYSLLEQQVIPEFYTRNEKGLPQKWIEKMRKSMATLAPHFSANRTVREYSEKYYLPLAESYVSRAADKGATGKRITNIKSELRAKWSDIHFGEVEVESVENGYAFKVDVFLNGIDPGSISVELFANGQNGFLPEKIEMQPVAAIGDENKQRYEAIIHTTRPANDYTVRIVPGYENISEPLEDNLILWQR